MREGWETICKGTIFKSGGVFPCGLLCHELKMEIERWGSLHGLSYFVFISFFPLRL